MDWRGHGRAENFRFALRRSRLLERRVALRQRAIIEEAEAVTLAAVGEDIVRQN
jgi:hypothetical protein